MTSGDPSSLVGWDGCETYRLEAAQQVWPPVCHLLLELPCGAEVILIWTTQDCSCSFFSSPPEHAVAVNETANATRSCLHFWHASLAEKTFYPWIDRRYEVERQSGPRNDLCVEEVNASLRGNVHDRSISVDASLDDAVESETSRRRYSYLYDVLVDYVRRFLHHACFSWVVLVIWNCKTVI